MMGGSRRTAHAAQEERHEWSTWRWVGGVGEIGRLHALCYRMLPLTYPDLPVTAPIIAVATASAASAERARRDLGTITATTDLDALLRHPDVAIVDCCAPTGDHVTIARAALMAGKRLFCEKPLAATAAESEQIAALAQERGLLGGINFHFRQIPAIQEAHRRIQAGVLGDITGFHMRYYRASNLRPDRPANWRFTGPGSGVLVDLGSHLIDLTLHLLGPIAAVGAHTRTLFPTRPGPDGQPMPVESDDVAWIEVELAGGGRGTLEASKVVPGAGDDVRIEAYGTRGMLVVDTQNPNLLNIVEGENGGISRQQIATLSQTQPPAALPRPETPTGVLQWHLASIASFLTAVGTNTRPRPDLNDGLHVDRVVGAAAQSARQHGARIAL